MEKNGEEKDGHRAEAGRESRDLPIDFTMFILSLSSSAMMSMGVIENPVTNKVEKDLPTARQTIDLISMLKEKTRGNLNADEAKLVDDVLHELRVRYCNLAL